MSYTEDIKSLAIEKYGELPIIKVIERAAEQTANLGINYDGEFVIDLKKLSTDKDAPTDDYEVLHIYSILAEALKGSTETGAFRKYSFGDSPEWWDEVGPDTYEGRILLTITVDVEY